MTRKDWSTSTVDSFYNQAGGAEVVENFIGGIYELPPARDVRRLRLKENVTSAACQDRSQHVCMCELFEPF